MKRSAAASRSDRLVTFLTTDYAGISRGRSIRASNYAGKGKKSLGWVPANMSLTPFDLIADANPWGSAGDLRLLADENAHYRLRPEGSATDLDIVMSDIVELDGTPWICCPRSFLRAALADFERETKLTIVASFEHEFKVVETQWQEAPAFSLQALRRADPFGPVLMRALTDAGVEPEAFIAEYGADQYEVTCRPAPGLVAADRAVVIREVTREIARNRGWRATFAPKTAIDGVGNGVHIHFSFRDRKGRNATFDPKRPGRISAIAGAFAAGIVRHLPALTAFTAPSPVSYLRLTPHNWSASYTWFGERDRESSLRICPAHAIGGADPAASFNLEYRAADATACPHMALAVVLRAGLAGIRERLPDPPLFSGDPALLGEDERRSLGLRRLPTTLEEALAELQADETASSWLAPAALETYTGMKRMELKLVSGMDAAGLCRRYATVY